MQSNLIARLLNVPCTQPNHSSVFDSCPTNTCSPLETWFLEADCRALRRHWLGPSSNRRLTGGDLMDSLKILALGIFTWTLVLPEKFSIRETLNLSMCADSSSNTKIDRNGQKRVVSHVTCHVGTLMAKLTFLHIINSNYCYRQHFKAKLKNFCVHNCTLLVNTHDKNHMSRKMSRNKSALGNMNNIQTWIAQLVEIGLTLSHFSVKACGLVLHP